MSQSIHCKSPTIMSNALAWQVKPYTLVPINEFSGCAFEVLFLILGGLPFFLPILCWVGESRISQNVPIDWLIWGNQLANLPHLGATCIRLGRKIHERRVSFWVGLPALMAIFILFIGSNYLTLNGEKSLLYLLTVVNVWQSYHYLRQMYGIGRHLDQDRQQGRLERTVRFWAFHGAMPLFVLGRWNMIYLVAQGKSLNVTVPVRNSHFLNHKIDLLFAGFIHSCALLMQLLWILAAMAALMGIAAEVIRYRRSRNYDCRSLLVLLAYYVIHWYGFLCETFYATAFVAMTIFHGIQYLAIVWVCECRQTSSNLFGTKVLRMVPAGISFLMFGIFLYLVVVFIQVEVFRIGNVYWPEFSAICLSAISTHHYLTDAVMWGRKAGI